jgi:beta-lactam-binding protein with PASTA domain
MATMPNLVGLGYPAALASLVAAGVRVLPLGYFQTDPVTLIWLKATAGKVGGVVTLQTPSNGATIAPNAAVSLTVANYPVSVAYPAGNTNV